MRCFALGGYHSLVWRRKASGTGPLTFLYPLPLTFAQDLGYHLGRPVLVPAKDEGRAPSVLAIPSPKHGDGNTLERLAAGLPQRLELVLGQRIHLDCGIAQTEVLKVRLCRAAIRADRILVELDIRRSWRLRFSSIGRR